jgi:hypothetical protein
MPWVRAGGPRVARDEALCHPERSEAELKDLVIEWNPCPATAYALTALCTAGVPHLPIHPIGEICAICGFFLAFSDNSEHSILCFQCLAVAALLRSNTTKDEALATARICRGIRMR